MSNLNELQSLVIDWASDKGILNKSLPKQQMKKTLEEVEELRLAIEDDNYPEISDGIGDVAVTLIILAEMYGTDFNECLQSAYDEIKGRAGEMRDGLFVKNT